MKQTIRKIILDAALKAKKNGELPSENFPQIEIETPKIESHGDFSTNFAMIMASIQKMPPRKIAEIIIKNIDNAESIIEKTDVAGPGFINFFLTKASWFPVLKKIHKQGNTFGASDIGEQEKVQVEFVSANPTGPLHVGHGRGAAVGDAMARILAFSGFSVQREYYVNDSGRQIRTLGLSVYLRCQELSGKDIKFPEDCYQGAYIVDLAKELLQKNAIDPVNDNEEDAVEVCAKYAASCILKEIEDDLKSFNISFDNWFSEQTLYDDGKVDNAIQVFKEKGTIYEKDNALWFKTSDYGDEKDRVVVRSNGLTTYFASDIAYHQDKFKRGFNRIIDVWGADHHGYIPRIKASIEASGRDRDKFDVILIQLVNLLRGGEPLQMSTRSGEFETLADVIDEVGCDAARFIFLTRHYESALDFDLEIAKKKTNDNPVYYVQYVHARIESILRKGKEEKGIETKDFTDDGINTLLEPEEIRLMKNLSIFPEVVEQSALKMEPHRITYYLMDLASSFHGYYNKHKVLTDDEILTMGRMYLITAVKTVIKNGLSLLGVSAPEKM